MLLSSRSANEVTKAQALTSRIEVEVEVEVEDNLRPTVSRPLCPGVGHASGTRDQFFFLLEIFFRQLRFCYFVAPSLTRGRVCNLLVQLLLGLARAVTLKSKSRRTHGYILLSHLRLSQGLKYIKLSLQQTVGAHGVVTKTETCLTFIEYIGIYFMKHIIIPKSGPVVITLQNAYPPLSIVYNKTSQKR
jgi:hypothetical protein